MRACVYVCVGSFTSGSKRYWVHGLGSYVVMTTDYNNATPSPLPSLPLLLPSLTLPLLSPHFLQCSCYVALDKTGSTGWNLKVELQFSTPLPHVRTICVQVCVCHCVCVCVGTYIFALALIQVHVCVFLCVLTCVGLAPWRHVYMYYTQSHFMGVQELTGDPWPLSSLYLPSLPFLTPHCAWHKCVHLFWYLCEYMLVCVSMETCVHILC